MLDEHSPKEVLDRTLHDLKTPLTNIKTYSHLLKKQLEGKNDKELTKYAEKIEKNLDRATTLLNSFTDTVREILKDKKPLT